MTIDLHTPADVSKVRAILLKEQEGKCAITAKVFPSKDFHTDHAHDEEQLVRAALYKQSNMVLGKIENLWIRYLAFWYDEDLPTFLRQVATYLERPKDTRWRHPGWIKKLQTKFNTLKSTQQDNVLVALGQHKGKNLVERKKLFLKAIKTKQFGYDIIRSIINEQKG